MYKCCPHTDTSSVSVLRDDVVASKNEHFVSTCMVVTVEKFVTNSEAIPSEVRQDIRSEELQVVHQWMQHHLEKRRRSESADPQALVPAPSVFELPTQNSLAKGKFVTNLKSAGVLSLKILRLQRPQFPSCRLKTAWPKASPPPSVVMNFAFEIRRESNPRGANLSNLIRSSTFTTRPTVYIRLEPKVPITCDRNLRYHSYIHGRPSG